MQFVAIALAIVLLVTVGLRIFCRLPTKPDGEFEQSVSDRASPLIERAEEVVSAHWGQRRHWGIVGRTGSVRVAP